MNVLAASLTAGLAEMPGKNHVEDDAAEAGNHFLWIIDDFVCVFDSRDG